MNITLSADEKLIARAREYARAQGTTLNQLVRDYLERVTNGLDPERAAQEFLELSRTHAGRSEPGFRFDRNAIHERGSKP
jgi:hypothetical protein